MKITLSLITVWFSLTKKKIKLEDYRNITPYWCNRLLLYNGEIKSKEWWILNFFKDNSIQEIATLLKANTSFKKFDCNVMTLGYPSNDNTERILKLEHKGIEIRTGNPEWGAEPNKLYFVIMHGAILA